MDRVTATPHSGCFFIYTLDKTTTTAILHFSSPPGLFLKPAMHAIINYLKEAKAELKKVSWPSKKETTNYTLIVIALSVGMAVFFGLLDFVFSSGLARLIQ